MSDFVAALAFLKLWRKRRVMQLKTSTRVNEEFRNKIVLYVKELLDSPEQTDAAREYLESILEIAKGELTELADSNRRIEWEVNHSFPEMDGPQALTPDDVSKYLPEVEFNVHDLEDFDVFEESLHQRLESDDFPGARRDQSPATKASD